jgi:rubrerythrin
VSEIMPRDRNMNNVNSESMIVMPEPASLSRRSFFGKTGALTLSATAVALLAGCGTMAAQSNEAGTSDIEILNGAIGAEQEAIAAYQLGVDSGLLQPAVAQLALAFQRDHSEHEKVFADTIRQLGGAPAPAQSDYNFPVADLKSQADVLAFVADLEQGVVSAYVQAVSAFQNSDLKAAAASILGAEAMHWAVLRSALGENPVPSAFVS